MDRTRAWLMVYCFNLLIPGFLGLLVTNGYGVLGLAVGIVLCWYAGLVLCKRSALLGSAFYYGGIFVSLCQLWPIAHFYLGGWAISLSKPFELVQYEYGNLTSFLGGLAVTCIVGFCLMLASLIIGLNILWLSEVVTPRVTAGGR